MAEFALRNLLEDWLQLLQKLALVQGAMYEAVAFDLGATLRMWQAGVVAPSGLWWNAPLADVLIELGYDRPDPGLDLISDGEPKDLGFDARVLRIFGVQLSILEGVVSVSGGGCGTSTLLGHVLINIYDKVVAPSGLDDNGQLWDSLRAAAGC